MKLSEQDAHNIGHARYLVERATGEKPEVCFDFTLVRSVLNVIDRQSNEILAVSRTGSEAEAAARVEGYKQGRRDCQEAIRSLIGVE